MLMGTGPSGCSPHQKQGPSCASGPLFIPAPQVPSRSFTPMAMSTTPPNNSALTGTVCRRRCLDPHGGEDEGGAADEARRRGGCTTPRKAKVTPTARRRCWWPTARGTWPGRQRGCPARTRPGLLDHVASNRTSSTKATSGHAGDDPLKPGAQQPAGRDQGLKGPRTTLQR